MTTHDPRAFDDAEPHRMVLPPVWFRVLVAIAAFGFVGLAVARHRSEGLYVGVALVEVATLAILAMVGINRGLTDHPARWHLLVVAGYMMLGGVIANFYAGPAAVTYTGNGKMGLAAVIGLIGVVAFLIALAGLLLLVVEVFRGVTHHIGDVRHGDATRDKSPNAFRH